jgi:branched-chain amino acid aminotransferase
MSEAVLDNFIHNGTVYRVSDFDNIYTNAFPSVYEVIRIMNGTALFLEEHYERLINSASLLGFSIDITFEEIKQNILQIIKINKVSDYNLKIVINNLDSPGKKSFYFFIASNYPTEEMYQKGIYTILFNAVRDNPNAKVIYQDLRDEINYALKEKKAYEALLVNSKGEITEGSRSNTFFIKSNIVYTAPAKDVLLGITRQRIINILKANNITVKEDVISVGSLNEFDAAFMSGTSPKVLPISSIDNLKLSVQNSLLIRIMELYNTEIMNYLKLHR